MKSGSDEILIHSTQIPGRRCRPGCSSGRQTPPAPPGGSGSARAALPPGGGGYGTTTCANIGFRKIQIFSFWNLWDSNLSKPNPNGFESRPSILRSFMHIEGESNPRPLMHWPVPHCTEPKGGGMYPRSSSCEFKVS